MEKEQKLRGLSTIRLSRQSLFEVVEKNKDIHANQFAEAYVGWKVQIIEQLEEDLKEQHRQYRRVLKDEKKKVAAAKERLDRVQSGDFETDKPYFRTRCPEHHIKDYNGTLKKLELSLDKELELEQHEFNRFVMDEWEWKETFSSTHICYSNSVRSGSLSTDGQYNLVNAWGNDIPTLTGSIASAVLNGDFNTSNY